MKQFNIAYIGFMILLVLEYCPVKEYNWDFGVGMWILISTITVMNSKGFLVLIDMCMEEIAKQEDKQKEDKKDI